MQSTNQSKRRQSRCSFCNSVNRGKGCLYAPYGVHFHPDDHTKCSYCNSPNFGRGCKLNPTSDLHVRGSVFNSMLKDSVQNFMDNEILINELKKDYKNFECYKLGIIDDKGNKLKTPVTEAEQMSFSPMTKTVIRLKKYLGSKIDLLEASTLFEKESFPITDMSKYKKLLEYKDKINAVTDELFKVLEEANGDGLSLEDVKMLLKA